MKLRFFYFFLAGILFSGAVLPAEAAPFARKSEDAYVLFETRYGSMVIRLYKETPKHRDNFLALVRKGVFNKHDLNRVVRNFVLQGGETDSAYEALEKEKGLSAFKRVPTEFRPELFHKKGAFAAGRDVKPEKTSFPAQYYFVQGRKYTEDELNKIEQKRGDGFIFPDAHRDVYKTLGGTPGLDQLYTVFGEVVKGIEVIDVIAALPVEKNDRPLRRIDVKIRILKAKDVMPFLEQS